MRSLTAALRVRGLCWGRVMVFRTPGGETYLEIRCTRNISVLVKSPSHAASVSATGTTALWFPFLSTVIMRLQLKGQKYLDRRGGGLGLKTY